MRSSNRYGSGGRFAAISRLRASALLIVLLGVLFAPSRALLVDAASYNLTISSQSVETWSHGGSIDEYGNNHYYSMSYSWPTGQSVPTYSLSRSGYQYITVVRDMWAKITFNYSELHRFNDTFYRQGAFKFSIAMASETLSGWTRLNQRYEFVDGDVYGQYQTDFDVHMYDFDDAFSVCNFKYLIRGGAGNQSDTITLHFKAYVTYYGTAAATMTNLLTAKTYNLTLAAAPVNRFRNVEVSDYEPYIKDNHDNLQALTSAIVNDQVAGDVLQDANDTFVDSAGSYMTAEAALQDQADAAFEQVDFDAVDMIGTYSQSISFWGQLIGALPQAIGSFWEVIVFGFLIAFLVFILRLVR